MQSSGTRQVDLHSKDSAGNPSPQRRTTANSRQTLNKAKTARLMLARLRRSQLQQIARDRRDDPAFPWEGFGAAVTNEALYLPGGDYLTPSGKPVTWPAANAATALCFGTKAPFSTIDEVPADVLARVEKGVAKALAVGVHLKDDGATPGRQVHLTTEQRDRLKTWLIRPVDATWDELAERADERRRQRAAERRANREAERETDRMRKAAVRRKEGVMARADYEASSLSKLAPWVALGISRRSFYRKPTEERTAILEKIGTGAALDRGTSAAAFGTGATVTSGTSLSVPTSITYTVPDTPVPNTDPAQTDYCDRTVTSAGLPDGALEGAPMTEAEYQGYDGPSDYGDLIIEPEEDESETVHTIKFTATTDPVEFDDDTELSIDFFAQITFEQIDGLLNGDLRGQRAFARFAEILDRAHKDLTDMLSDYDTAAETVEAAICELDFRVHKYNAARGADLQAIFKAESETEVGCKSWSPTVQAAICIA